MRIYIRSIKTNEGNDFPTFEFCKRIEAAMHWDTRERAGHMVSSERGGITVKAPDGAERTAHISDFKIEERPQGGFAISCEDPFSIN